MSKYASLQTAPHDRRSEPHARILASVQPSSRRPNSFGRAWSGAAAEDSAPALKVEGGQVDRPPNPDFA